MAAAFLNSKIKICRRKAMDAFLLPHTLSPLLRRLYTQRGVTHASELERSVKNLHSYESLSGIHKAVDILHCALVDNRSIMVVGDFDADGATGTALTVLALRSMGGNNVNYLVPNRFNDGYGLSTEVVEQAATRGAQLIVTVDNGTSSYAGVTLAREKGISVIITDHHLPGAHLPEADVIINPNLSHCEFPSRALAGVGVAFYLMLALRKQLRDSGISTLPNLAELLDLVALGTIADIVPLDANNRILVWQGLSRIRAGKCRPGIRALLEISNRDAQKLTINDLGFVIGPRLNAAGRLDDMSIGVALLLNENADQARMLARKLDVLNQARKEIEQNMHSEALALCSYLENSHEGLPMGIAIYCSKWHQGVVGILASRLRERFNRPVIAFAPAGNETLKGSGRSIAGLHMRDALERLNALHPGLIIKFGGHAMAAGLSLKKEKFNEFRQRFNELLVEYLDADSLHSVVWSDGELRPQELTLQTAELLREAGPWGQAFPEPLFDGKFKLLQQRLVGEHHLKVMVEPLCGGPLLNAIAFNIDTSQWPDPSVKQVEMAYKLDINEFRGNRNLQLIIDKLWVL